MYLFTRRVIVNATQMRAGLFSSVLVAVFGLSQLLPSSPAHAQSTVVNKEFSERNIRKTGNKDAKQMKARINKSIQNISQLSADLNSFQTDMSIFHCHNVEHEYSAMLQLIGQFAALTDRLALTFSNATDEDAAGAGRAADEAQALLVSFKADFANHPGLEFCEFHIEDLLSSGTTVVEQTGIGRTGPAAP